MGFDDDKGGHARSFAPSFSTPHSAQSPNPFPGQKRKREHSPNGSQRNGRPGFHGPSGPQHRGRPEKARAKPAPSIPSFGFPPVPQKPKGPPAQNQDRDRNKKRGKKRKTNQLGLTPSGDLPSDDEDVDEEAAALAKLNGNERYVVFSFPYCIG